jgi:DNA-binding transcriptional ArsR family regulator
MNEQFVERADPEAVFGVLSNETRVAVLEALQDADGHEATFSELRDAVGMTDPGQFNYHLNKFTGRFVASTDDGYRLTQAGKQMAGALASGAFTVSGELDPIELSNPCQACGDTLTLSYENEIVRVACDSCSAVSAFAVPPAVLAGRDRETIPDVASRYLRTTIRQQYSGFCWYCNGRVESTVAPASTHDAADAIPMDALGEAVDGLDHLPWVSFDCRRCGATASTSLETVLLDHPAVAGFYHDHGVDVERRLVWSFPPVSAVSMAIPRREPLRATVTYSVDGDERTLVTDASLETVDVQA